MLAAPTETFIDDEILLRRTSTTGEGTRSGLAVPTTSCRETRSSCRPSTGRSWCSPQTTDSLPQAVHVVAGSPGPAMASGFSGRIVTGLPSRVATVTHRSAPASRVILAPVSMVVKRAGRLPAESSTSSSVTRTLLPRVPGGRSMLEVPCPIGPDATLVPSTITDARVTQAVSPSSPGPGACVTVTSDRLRSGPEISHHPSVMSPPGTQADEGELSAALEARRVIESK